MSRDGLAAPAGAVGAALLGALLVALAPRGLLLVVLVPVQTLLAYGWLTLADVPARLGGTAIALGAGVAADVALTVGRHGQVGALAGVVGVGVVAAVLGQLLRRERSRVTDVLAAQCSAVLLVAAASPLVALAALRRGDATAAAGLLGLALCLLAGEAVARLLPSRPAARPLAGLVLGGGAAAGVGAALAGGAGAAAGAAAAAATVVAELLVVAAAPGRRVAGPLGALLPFALVGPCAYVVGRAVLG